MMSLRVPSSAQVAYTRTTHARRARGGRRGRLDNTRVFQVAMSGYLAVAGANEGLRGKIAGEGISKAPCARLAKVGFKMEEGQ